MKYTSMCCDEAPVPTKAVTEGNSYNIKEILDDTEKILFETHDILLSIRRNILNMPNDEPADDLPKALCMNDQAIINRNMSDMCRSYAIDIKRMLFGGDLE